MRGRVVVVGGGIAGLASARALREDDWDVEVLERADALPTTGTALGMWPAAMVALDALGVGDEVRRRGVATREAALLRPDGRVLARPRPKGTTYLLPRPTLHDVLYDQDHDDAVVWGSTVDDVEQLMHRADLVIGADGIHSRVRAHVVGQDHGLRPLGCVAFRGTVDGPIDHAAETWGDGRLFGTTPHDAVRTNWFASVRMEVLAGRPDEEEVVAMLRELYGDWHPGVKRVLEQLEPATVDRRVLYDLPPLPTLHRGNAVILGDAAHAMAPNAGRGACEALVDAVALREALRSTDTVGQALRRFDTDRRRAGQRVVRASRLMSRVATIRRGSRARDAVVTLASKVA